MSRKKHTWKELKAFKILRDALRHKVIKIDKSSYMIEEQMDKPDFAFIMRKKHIEKRIGIEVCSIDNGKLFEGEKIYKPLAKPNKAKEKYNQAMLLPKPLTLTHETTSITEDRFKEILKKKFKLYEEYKKNFSGGVFLLLHTESYSDKKLYEALRFHLNHFCVDYKCPFDKVFLIDLKYNRYIGKVFEKHNPKNKLNIPVYLENLKSETYVRQFFPVGQELNIWQKYE